MRPRIVRLPEGGEVVIKNVDPAKADQIKAFLLGQSDEALPAQEKVQEPQPVKSAEYTHKALAIINGPKTKLVTIKFDPVSGVGVVESTQEAMDKYDATLMFKKLAVELDFV